MADVCAMQSGGNNVRARGTYRLPGVADGDQMR